MICANNKGADQPAHSRSLISTIVVCCLDGIISLVSISSHYLASVAAQAGLSLPLVANPEDRFSHDKAHLIQLMSPHGSVVLPLLESSTGYM